jgi:hypothetical protein
MEDDDLRAAGCTSQPQEVSDPTSFAVPERYLNPILSRVTCGSRLVYSDGPVTGNHSVPGAALER